MGLFSRAITKSLDILSRVTNIFKRMPTEEPFIKPVEPIRQAQPAKPVEPIRQAQPAKPRGMSRRARKRQKRANAIYQKEINLASSGDTDTSLGKYGQEKTKIFYKATQRLWEGSVLEDRGNIIMQRLGVNSMEEAMNIVLSQNAEAFKYAMKTHDTLKVGTSEQVDNKTSPDYLAYVNNVVIA